MELGVRLPAALPFFSLPPFLLASLLLSVYASTVLRCSFVTLSLLNLCLFPYVFLSLCLHSPPRRWHQSLRGESCAPRVQTPYNDYKRNHMRQGALKGGPRRAQGDGGGDEDAWSLDQLRNVRRVMAHQLAGFLAVCVLECVYGCLCMLRIRPIETDTWKARIGSRQAWAGRRA